MRLLLAATLAAGLVGGPAALADHVVSQKDKKFSAAALSVRPGEAVVFRNDDAVPHNVFSSSAGAAFNLKSQSPGAESRVAFDKPGKVEVRCAFHPTMKMTVTVAP